MEEVKEEKKEEEVEEDTGPKQYVIGWKGVFARLEKFLKERKWTVKQLFRSKRINKDQSELIRFDEFKDFIISDKFLGMDHLSESDIREIFDAVDTGKTNGIDMDELNAAMKLWKTFHKDNKDYMKQLWIEVKWLRWVVP